MWPSSSAAAPQRTNRTLLNIYELLNDAAEGNISPLNSDQVKGVVSRSLLYDLEYFNFIRDIPTEYMLSLIHI